MAASRRRLHMTLHATSGRPHLPPRPRRRRPSPARSTTGSRCHPRGSRRLRLLQHNERSGRPRPLRHPACPPTREPVAPTCHGSSAGPDLLSRARPTGGALTSAQLRPPPPPKRDFFPFSKWRPMSVAPPDDVIPLRLLGQPMPRGLPGARRAQTETASTALT